MGAIELEQAGSPTTSAPPLQRPLPGWGSLPIHMSSHRGVEQDMDGEKGEEMLGKLKGPIALGVSIHFFLFFLLAQSD